MPSSRRWWRVWVRADDPPRTEDTLRIFATDEHSIYKQCASEGRQVTACFPEYHTHPTGDFGPEEE